MPSLPLRQKPSRSTRSFDRNHHNHGAVTLSLIIKLTKGLAKLLRLDKITIYASLVFPFLIFGCASFGRVAERHEVTTNSIGWCAGAWGGGEYIGRADRAPDGFVAVGYDKIWLPGAEPFPCGHSIDHRYAALLEFDARGEPVERAILRPIELLAVTPAPRGRPVLSCELTISLAQETVSASPTGIPSRIDITPGSPTQFRLGPILVSGEDHPGVDVTAVVQEWNLGSRPNLGFVVAYENPFHHGDDESCVYYSRFVLDIQRQTE